MTLYMIYIICYINTAYEYIINSKHTHMHTHRHRHTYVCTYIFIYISIAIR